jgi:hypothetical protein
MKSTKYFYLGTALLFLSTILFYIIFSSIDRNIFYTPTGETLDLNITILDSIPVACFFVGVIFLIIGQLKQWKENN